MIKFLKSVLKQKSAGFTPLESSALLKGLGNFLFKFKRSFKPYQKLISEQIRPNHPNFLTGFTLMEMVVVLAVFSTTAVMAVDLFLTVTKIQRQTRNTQVAQSDARFVLEAMVKEIRNGTIDYEYYQGVCQGPEVQNPGDPCTEDIDCLDGSCLSIDLTNPTYILATRDQENNQIFYRLNNEEQIEVCSNTHENLTRCDLASDPPQNNWQMVTPTQVKVTDLRFYIFPASNPFSVRNSCTLETQDDDCDSRDCVNHLCIIHDSQPMVTIILETESGSGAEQEKVNLQTSSTSMIYRR